MPVTNFHESSIPFNSTSNGYKSVSTSNGYKHSVQTRRNALVEYLDYQSQVPRLSDVDALDYKIHGYSA